MNTIIEKELIYINGGMTSIAGGGVSRENSAEKQQRMWQEQEMRRLEGLADIRKRAADDALRAAARVQHQEMEIKEAQRAEIGM